MLRRFVIAIAFLQFVGLEAGDLAAQPTDIDRERAAIASMYQRRLRLISAAANPESAAEAYVRDLADDAVWMPPNAPTVRGKQAVHAWARDFFGKYDLQIDTQTIEPLEIGGTIAIRRFTTKRLSENN